jgi:effector-associated domain 1 (EAD1)-containing protein
VKLTGAQIKRLCDEINERFQIDELRRVVRFRLDVALDDVASAGPAFDRIFELVDWAMRQERLSALFDGLVDENPAIGPVLEELRRAAAATAPMTTGGDGQHADDPAARLLIYGEPFVNRRVLAELLEQLWSPQEYNVLLVHGDRHSGRSHSWWLIKRMAADRKVSALYLDLAANPAAWTVDEVINRVVPWARLPRELLSDSLSQATRKSTSFLAALARHSEDTGGGSPRRCLVVDGIDRVGVAEAVLELMDELIGEVLSLNIASFSVVMLGYNRVLTHPFATRALTEPLTQIGRGEVEAYLGEVAGAWGKRLDAEGVGNILDTIFRGLGPRLDLAGMKELNRRVRRFGIDVLRNVA